jgi:hypothetical protein
MLKNKKYILFQWQVNKGTGNELCASCRQFFTHTGK